MKYHRVKSLDEFDQTELPRLVAALMDLGHTQWRA